jgi:hypothetical protein
LKGISVRKKIALLTLVATFAISLFAVQSAYASYVNVFVTPSATGFCRTAPDILSYRLAFKADVTASGVAKPKKVRIGFQVVDSDTKRVIRSGVVNLKKKSGYKGQTKRFEAVAGENLSYHVNMSYTIKGSTKKLKKSYPDSIPSQAELDAAGLPNC